MLIVRDNGGLLRALQTLVGELVANHDLAAVRVARVLHLVLSEEDTLIVAHRLRFRRRRRRRCGRLGRLRQANDTLLVALDAGLSHAIDRAPVLEDERNADICTAVRERRRRRRRGRSRHGRRSRRGGRSRLRLWDALDTPAAMRGAMRQLAVRRTPVPELERDTNVCTAPRQRRR